MEKEKMLLSANIPKELWELCVIKNGNIYPPSVEKQIELGAIDKSYKQKQIDICPEPKPKTLEELTKENEQLWETVQFLLKKTGMIGDEKNEIL